MTSRVLRSRLAALVLLLASPGFAGLAVDAVHPCPENAPWTVEDQGHHHDTAPAERHDCKCVGSCQSAVVASVDARTVAAFQNPVEHTQPTPFHPGLVFLGRPQDRLPPATAPPLV